MMAERILFVLAMSHLAAALNQSVIATLNPSSGRCPYKCKAYFAGAGNHSARVCQKQASGVGTAQQNLANGVSCYPAYGCNQDMVTCVNQDWTDELPDISNHTFACQGLEQLVAEDPWTCGREGKPDCKHDTPNNNAGQWLKASSNLGCGWGSTYGNTHPGYIGSSRPATTIINGVSDLTSCCLEAMKFESSSWESGGAALFWELRDGICRVDREKIIYGNLDSSSGRSVKYQNTRCGDVGEHFFYRHAAGAADASNLNSGGRCAVMGNFKPVHFAEAGLNMIVGELPYGQELPNHACPATTNSQDTGCTETLMFNTINDNDGCCNMCLTLSWLTDPSNPSSANVGGDRSMDADGKHANPCVAWQIVEGRCRILRKAYVDRWNAGQTVLDAVSDNDYSAPGNTNWVVRHRGCQTPEDCTYYSHIYLRDVNDVTPPEGLPGNATYRKLVKIVVPEATDTINMSVNITSFDTRRGMRNDMLSADGTDCGRVEVFPEEDMATKEDITVFSDKREPICVSDCVTSGSVILNCSGLTSARRLSQDSGVGKSALQASHQALVLSFTSVGSGYDNVNYETDLAPWLFAAETLDPSGSSKQTTQTTTPAPGTSSGSFLSASSRTCIESAALMIGLTVLLMIHGKV
jgi:hypothetical protein